MNDVVMNHGTVSTTLDTGTVQPSGAGHVDVPREETPEAKPAPSIRDVLKAEEAKLRAEEGKTEVKAEKPEPVADKVEVKAEKSEEQPKVEAEKPEPKDNEVAKSDGEVERVADKRSSEGRRDAPARFLPEAREQWANTPRTVKAEVERFMADHEQEVTRYREGHEKYEAIREYEDMATKQGTTVKAALDHYVGLERMLSQDPAKGIGQILNNMRSNPQAMQAALGEVMRYAGVTPQQFAQQVMQNPQAYQQAPQQPQQRQADPMLQQTVQEVQQIKQMLAEDQMQKRVQSVEASIIAPFAQTHERFEELSTDIANLLKSDIIENTYGRSLTLQQRLEVAYNMAAALKPSMQAPRQAALATDAEVESVAAPLPSTAGNKSIKGAIGGGKEPPKSARPPSIRDALLNAHQQSRAQA